MILPSQSKESELLQAQYEYQFNISQRVANRQLRSALRYWFDVRGDFTHSRADIDNMVEQALLILGEIHDNYGGKKITQDTLATD